MRCRWVAVVALAAMSQTLMARAAPADTDTEEETEADEESDEAPEAGPRVILRINRPTARLQQRTMLGWRNICIPPCGAVVDPSALYRVGGGGAVISAPFQLPRDSGDVFVEGKVGSKANLFVGTGFLIAGVLILGLEAIMLAVRDDVTRTEGLVVIGIGAFVAAIGGALMTGGRTSVRVR